VSLLFATPVYAATSAEHGAEHAGPLFSLFGLEVSSVVTTMWAIMIIITVVAYFSTRKLEKIPTRRLQNFMEIALEAILDQLTQAMGEEKYARRYFPLLASFFILILASNYSGFIPGASHITGLQAPTSTLGVTAGFALIVFFATHYYGVKTKGLKYFKHFTQPFIFMLPLNIIDELVRPVSLSLRLFGNVYGEEMVIASLFSLIPLFVPLPMMFLGVLFGLIQAFVFTSLAAVYIAGAVQEHHE